MTKMDNSYQEDDEIEIVGDTEMDKKYAEKVDKNFSKMTLKGQREAMEAFKSSTLYSTEEEDERSKVHKRVGAKKRKVMAESDSDSDIEVLDSPKSKKSGRVGKILEKNENKRTIDLDEKLAFTHQDIADHQLPIMMRMPGGVSQKPAHMANSMNTPSTAKRSRMVTNVQSELRTSNGPRMPPGPRMWKSPALATQLPWGGPTRSYRPISRQLGIVSHSFQTEVEVITVEEEVGDVGEEWCARLKNLPTNITVERQKDEVGCIIYSCTLFCVLFILQASLEREARRNNDPGCQQARWW